MTEAQSLVIGSAVQGNSEMAGRIAAFDWDSTPLGPPSVWPQSLKTSLSLILGSQHPMWIGWGPEMTFFYNDAYISVLSLAKHPWALGKPASVVWSEIWDVCGPLAAKVFEQGEASFLDDVQLFMNRGDMLEETYYSFSYSPIRDESGQVGGLFCPSAEVSAKVINARRLRTLSDLAEHTLVERSAEGACATAAGILAANPEDIPFAMIYLADHPGTEAHLRESIGRTDGVGLSQHIELAEGFEGQPQQIALAIETGQAQLLPVANPNLVNLGLADQAVLQALVLPIISGGQEQNLGVLVAGVNPTRRLDEEYRSFYNLVAAHIATALSNADSYARERARAEELAELDRAKTAFFSNVSHEFRTPLTLMMGPLEDVLGQDGITAEARANIEAAHRNSQRLQRLVNSLLEFSRIEAGRLDASFVPTDLCALTTDLAGMFRSAIERAGLSLTIDCQTLPSLVYVDRDMWEKIVLNLLSNALKFTSEGGITVRLKQSGDTVELAVSDTGIGIPAPELAHMFERFHRVPNTWARTHEGSGIGLSMVQELVRLHHGEVTVESEEGHGTTFRVKLPVGRSHLPVDRIGTPAQTEGASLQSHSFVEEAMRWLPDADGNVPMASQDGASASPASVPAAAAGSSTTTVLYADDNADMRDYVSRLLATRWSVITAADGEAALEVVRRGDVSLVLTDIMMPGLDGFGLLRALRDDPATASIPVILLSARAGDEARVEGLEAGADDYLAKPFSARELVARVATHLELARLRNEIAAQREDMRSIFMQSPMPIAVVEGEDLVFTLVNPPMQEFNGREVLNRPLLEAVPEIAGQGFDELMLGVLHSGQPHFGEESLLRMERDGVLEDTYWTFVYAPLRDPTGETRRVMIVGREVTQEVLSRRATEEANQRLSQANALKDQFVSLVSHELRTPLTTVMANGMLLQRRGHLLADEDKQQALTDIVDESSRLQRIIENLLLLSRLEASVGPDLTPISIHELLSEQIDAFKRRQPSREVTLAPSAGEGIRALGQHDLIGMVVENLLTNANKYSPAGSPIEVSAVRSDDGSVEVRVSDRGIGIAEEDMPNLFTPFFRTGQAKNYSTGMGLGLAVCRRILDAHGGRIWAAGRPGGGTVFTFVLPGQAQTS